MRYEIMKFENIRSLRIDNSYTQKQIAEYLGISQNTYSQYEVGVLNYPVEALMKLADFYNVSVDYHGVFSVWGMVFLRWYGREGNPR